MFQRWVFLCSKSNILSLPLQDYRKIIAVYVGSRDKAGAQARWNALPAAYHQPVVVYTDFWAAYAAIIPVEQHHPVGKESGKTNHIERFNSTLRERIARLVRQTLSFSKKLVNHIGAIWYFIHHYNALLA